MSKYGEPWRVGDGPCCDLVCRSDGTAVARAAVGLEISGVGRREARTCEVEAMKKNLKVWIAVDGDGLAYGYAIKPKWNNEHRWFYDYDSVGLGKLPSHAGQCWRQEIAVPPVAKKRRGKR